MATEETRSLSGRQIGSYRVRSLIGVGGMGEVYRAFDSKLEREVALKVLPAAYARDPERLARLRREARILASLNHANIATIHGLEDSDDFHCLVMELVEGETLAARVSSGPVPVREALKIASQIAEALEAAHEKGIVHRDLKPANVKVTPQGKVKVLDLGLAKAYVGEGLGEDSNAPTISAAETEAGRIFGTPAYMSPEQARGRPVDRRTDIWAFGCLLYELLTGKSAFRGETVSDTVARVLEREPDWQAVPPTLPERGLELLQRCLEKDLTERRRDMGDVHMELEQIVRTLEGKSERVTAVAAAPQKNRQSRLVWAAAALVAIALASVVIWYPRPVTPLQVMRLNMDVSPADVLTGLT